MPTERPTLPFDTHERLLRRGQSYTPQLAYEVVRLRPPRQLGAGFWLRMLLDLGIIVCLVGAVVVGAAILTP